MDYNPDDLNKMPLMAAIIHQISSPRTVKAAIVYVFLLLVTLLVLQGFDIPQVLSSVLLLIVGSFFEPVLGKASEPVLVQGSTHPE